MMRFDDGGSGMKKVNWGVLSTAKIGWEKVIPAMQQSTLCSIDAIASRNLASAQSWAAKLGIPTAHGSYEDLIADPHIEAIYNPLPNDLHFEWTLKAARAGKHVLCEKPFAMNAREAAQVREVADKVHIMEAFMVRFHPQWLRARELVRSGELGDLRTVQVFFSYTNQDAANIRNRLENGGGALYDIGCYAIVAGRFLFESEPLRAIARVDRDSAQRHVGLRQWPQVGLHGLHPIHAVPAPTGGRHTKTPGAGDSV
jgi:predicted dehydrogenase